MVATDAANPVLAGRPRSPSRLAGAGRGHPKECRHHRGWYGRSSRPRWPAPLPGVHRGDLVGPGERRRPVDASGATGRRRTPAPSMSSPPASPTPASRIGHRGGDRGPGVSVAMSPPALPPRARGTLSLHRPVTGTGAGQSTAVTWSVQEGATGGERRRLGPLHRARCHRHLPRRGHLVADPTRKATAAIQVTATPVVTVSVPPIPPPPGSGGR